MRRTKLADRKLPTYSKKEELFNSASHYIGFLFAIYAFVDCLSVSKNKYDIIGCTVYGICMMFMFFLSGMYHGAKNKKVKKILQIIDHCGVFLMVAGTYTPTMMSGLRRTMPKTSWIMLSLVWAVTIVGIILNCIDLERYHIFSLVTHLVTGWALLAVIYPLYKAVGFTGTAYIIGGGIAYTAGSALYAKGKNIKNLHSIFHVFVLAGAIIQYLGIRFYFL